MGRDKIKIISLLKLKRLVCCKYTADMISSVNNLVFPFVIGAMIDAVFYAENINLFLKWSLVYTLFFVIKQLFSWLSYSLDLKMQKSFSSKLRMKLYHSILACEGGALHEFRSADLVYTLSDDVDKVNQYYNVSLSAVIAAIFQIVCIWGVMSYYNLGLSLVILMFSLGIVFLSANSKKQFKQVRTDYRKKQGEYMSWSLEYLAGMQDVWMNRAEEQTKTHFVEKTKQILKNKEKIRFVEIKAERIYGFISSLVTVVFWAAAAFMIISNRLTVGNFYVINQYFKMMIQKLEQINQEKINILGYGPSFDKINSILQLKAEAVHGGKNTEPEISGMPLSFCRVSFSYGASPILQNLSCSIEPGELTVIVGRNGEGKTTLLNLLLRLYSIETGAITIGKHSITELPVLWLRNHIGYVQQRSIIFSGTLRDNMRLFRPGCEDSEIWKALECCKMKETVEGWDKQLDTDLSYGERLSGGQRQRVALARIVLKNPSIVLMDEPTASLDAETELWILKDMKQIFSNKIVVMVSHRSEVVKAADHIIVMKDGSVLREGRHHELITDCNYYKTLFQ